MTSSQGKTLVFATGVAIAAETFIEASGKQYEGFSKGAKGGKEVAGATGSLFKKLFFLALVMVVLSFGIDMAPEFFGPLTLLILVAFLVNKAPVIKQFAEGK